MKNAAIAVVFKSAKVEFLRLIHSPLLVFLTITQAITFMLLINFFGMTGAFAPTAVIDYDKSVYSKNFIETLKAAHHSFAIKMTNFDNAISEFKKGKIVAFIQIPKGFSDSVKNGKAVTIFVAVNNIDTDMTADIERALPSAITRFGNGNKFKNIHVKTVEHDLISHDTGFIQYMVVSGFILNAFIIAGILAATSIATEFEKKTIHQIAISPSRLTLTIFGRLVTIIIFTSLLLLLTTPFILKIYQISPVDNLTMYLTIFLSTIAFSILGIALGTGIKRNFPVVSLVFGLSLPIFINSGSYEPERLDGNLIWGIAHLNPVYYIVGILQKAVWGFKVTPEPIWLLYVAILGWITLGIFLTWLFLKRSFVR
jgi:ABC-type transport system involved in cytochrome c biogenesis permease component